MQLTSYLEQYKLAAAMSNNANSKIPIPILLLVPNFPLPPAEIPHRHSIDNTFLLIGFCFVLLQICEVFDRQNYAELTSFLFQKQSLEYLRR